jgi:hypothetical protein
VANSTGKLARRCAVMMVLCGPVPLGDVAHKISVVLELLSTRAMLVRTLKGWVLCVYIDVCIETCWMVEVIHTSGANNVFVYFRESVEDNNLDTTSEMACTGCGNGISAITRLSSTGGCTFSFPIHALCSSIARKVLRNSAFFWRCAYLHRVWIASSLLLEDTRRPDG